MTFSMKLSIFSLNCIIWSNPFHVKGFHTSMYVYMSMQPLEIKIFQEPCLHFSPLFQEIELWNLLSNLFETNLKTVQIFCAIQPHHFVLSPVTNSVSREREKKKKLLLTQEEQTTDISVPAGLCSLLDNSMRSFLFPYLYWELRYHIHLCGI